MEHAGVNHQTLQSLLKNSAGKILQNFWNDVEDWAEQCLTETSAFVAELKPSTHDQDRITNLRNHIAFRKKYLALLEQKSAENLNPRYKDFSIILSTGLDRQLQDLPEFETLYQQTERFVFRPGDSTKIRLVKALKRTGLSITTLPVRFLNSFRRMAGKDVKDLPQWKQSIPVRKLAQWYYHTLFLQQFARLADEHQLDATKKLYELWQWDNLVYDHIKGVLLEGKDLQEFVATWKQAYMPHCRKIIADARFAGNKANEQLEALIQQQAEKYAEQYIIAGTLEFGTFAHREGKRRSKHRITLKKMQKQMQCRCNTIRALADDWAFNQEIYILSHHVFKTGLLFQTRLDARAEPFLLKLEKIYPLLKEIKSGIRNGTPEKLHAMLVGGKQSAYKNLQGMLLPELFQLMLEQNFPLLIDEAEQSFRQALLPMDKPRILLSGFDPTRAYATKSLQTVSPYVIVAFEMADRFGGAFLQAKTNTIERLEKLRQELDDLGRMVVYNLDSSLALLEQQGPDALEDSLLDAHESLQRAAANAESLQGAFLAYTEKMAMDIRAAGAVFISDLKQLTDNRNVEQIRYRITRARAINRTTRMWDLAGERMLNYNFRIKAMWRLTHRRVITGVEKIRGQLGIRGLDAQITTEISAFLIEGPSSLPFVYKRLFQIEPLRESTFYVERVYEKNKLLTAWESWQQGVFTPVLLYGEKGSGISTFVQMFVKEHVQRSPQVYSVLPARRVQSEEELLALLGNSLRGKAFEKAPEFYDFIDKNPPFVAFVDKLQLMYLRQPGGFNVLKRFFELISQTSRKVFWICTCGKYASQYLNKSVGLYSYFPSLIEMRNLRIEEVRRVIMLRHNASGYALSFIPAASDLLEKAYRKKDAAQKQEYLREKYFASLNRLTRSNIAFALQLWLRSAQKPEENTIYLDSLTDIDFGFMYNLSEEVVFALHALLLHESLDVFQLSQVLNSSKRQAWLMLMRLADRGMVIEERSFYTVHPLLYRQTIILLKERNLIQ